jgi:hypothetical protein
MLMENVEISIFSQPNILKLNSIIKKENRICQFLDDNGKYSPL